MELPRFVLFKSLENNTYLRCTNERHRDLRFVEAEDLSLDVKHEVVMAKCGGGLIHIRRCRTGKYLRRYSEGSTSLVVVADEPEEDQSKWYCTLFKPSPYTKDGVNVVLLQYFHRGEWSFLYRNSDGYFRVGEHLQVSGVGLHFIAVDWVSLMIKLLKDAEIQVIVSVGERKMRTLPRFVVFKSAHNNKYLCCDEDEPNLLRFNGKDAMSPYSKHEVMIAKRGDGLVHIRCCCTGKYWRRLSEDDHWIVAKADEAEEDLSKWSCTLFWPCYDAKKDDNGIELQHSQLGENTSLYLNCLTAAKSPHSTTEKAGLIAVDWESLPPKYPTVDDKTTNT
ncbi:hypothetical protein RHGRI_002380 [Rhododendron griersonianum]|uniref:Agglutinin domain-containing protein n=1 Tax=Rhododendron griersonianum TaxID=479676 RepID=A0AAV6LR12_9ERIC|nr:hypothetical protein RHGRI_002380 [Rhododendron griersonianum]